MTGVVLGASTRGSLARGLLGAVDPTPAPTQAPAGGFEAWEVSPGLLGFLPVFLIALACVGLFLSLTKQMRRVTVRQAQRDADDAAALAGGTAAPGGTAGLGGTAQPGGTARPGVPGPSHGTAGGRTSGRGARGPHDGTRPGDGTTGPR